MAKQTYTAYVKKYPDIEKAYHKNKGKRFPNAASYGKWHYDKYGSKEGRTIDGKAPSGKVPGTKGGGDDKYKLKSRSGRITSNDAYDATRWRRGVLMDPNADSLYQRGDSYDWKVTGGLQDLPRRKGMFGTRRAEKRIPMMVDGTKGYARVENIDEPDRSKWRFIFSPSGLSPHERYDDMTGPPDIYLGNLFEKKKVKTEKDPTKTKTTITTNTKDSGDDDGGGGERISGGLAKLDAQYADAIADLRRAALGIPKDAPAWVKTHADYLRWLRIRSGDSGFESTIVTSPVGLAKTDLTTGVRTTSLLSGA